MGLCFVYNVKTELQNFGATGLLQSLLEIFSRPTELSVSMYFETIPGVPAVD